MFAKPCLKQCPKRLLHCRVEPLSFATSQRSVAQPVGACFAAAVKAELQKLWDEERDGSQHALPPSRMVLLLVSPAFNVLTERSPKNPNTDRLLFSP